MRKPIWFAAMAALGLAMPILAGEFDRADARARITLNQCISKYNACYDRCIGVVLEGWAPLGPGNAQWGYCMSQCNASHTACVDLAMSSNGPAAPPKRRPPIIPGGNILETSPGFSPQAPSSTGTPVSAPPKQIIR